jgi:Mg-chelatase subunit ChlD/tetratricopeptide (TPR) repeat protein
MVRSASLLLAIGLTALLGCESDGPIVPVVEPEIADPGAEALGTGTADAGLLASEGDRAGRFRPASFDWDNLAADQAEGEAIEEAAPGDLRTLGYTGSVSGGAAMDQAPPASARVAALQTARAASGRRGATTSSGASPASITGLGRVARGATLVHNPTTPREADDFAGFDVAGQGDDSRDPARSWQRATALANSTALKVGDDAELPLRTSHVSVWVDGTRARVVLDGFYENDRDQRLKGSFKLRLPDGASPYYLAFGGATLLDVDGTTQPALFDPTLGRNGVQAPSGHAPVDIRRAREGTWVTLKEARMVPRDTAAHAFDETVRRQVDPALLEWSGSGVFSAQVFPLEPHTWHRIVVAYELDLTAVGSDRELQLPLPQGVDELSLDLFGRVPGGIELLAWLDEQALPAAELASGLHRNAVDARMLRVRVQDPGVLAIVDQGGQESSSFSVAFTPELPASDGDGGATAVFLLDTSLSGRDGSFAVQADLLSALLELNRDRIEQFAVLFFDTGLRWWRPGLTSNTAREAGELRAHCAGLALQGATDLATALQQAAQPSWATLAEAPDWDVFLLSDGAATWGPPNLDQALARLSDRGLPVFSYATGMSGSDRRALDDLARETGGAVFSVTGPEAIDGAALAHRSRPWHVEQLLIPGGSDLMLAGRPAHIWPGQELRLVGRGAPRAGDEIALVVSQYGSTATVVVTLDVTLQTDMARRAYGEVAVGWLESVPGIKAEDARGYATAFRVPGETCSLLMLDTEADYKRFGIISDDGLSVVSERLATDLVAAALQQQRSNLVNPQKAFLAWIERLEQHPAVMLDLPKGLKELIASLPESLFDVTGAPLFLPDEREAELSERYRECLGKSDDLYDDLRSEAANRSVPAHALRVLSNLVERFPDDGVVLREVGYRALDLGRPAQAYHLFRRVADNRPAEPETYRAMARCLLESGHNDLALVLYEIALWGHWPQRFGEFQRVAALDYLHLLRRIARGEVETSLHEFAGLRLGTVSSAYGPAEADLIVIISWNTDATDIDMHVVDPAGEHCYYGARTTSSGGQLSRDVTQGFGPELFVLEHAPSGEYVVGAHYFASDPNKAGVTTQVATTVYTDWGRPSERVQRMVVPLVEAGRTHTLGKLTLGNDSGTR